MGFLEHSPPTYSFMTAPLLLTIYSSYGMNICIFGKRKLKLRLSFLLCQFIEMIKLRSDLSPSNEAILISLTFLYIANMELAFLIQQ